MANTTYKFGMIGLGVMGRNLLLNMADHGFAVAGFDLDATKTTTLESSATPGTTVKGFNTLAEMVAGAGEAAPDDDAGACRQAC